jgi:cytosine/adenosine deaminase-related metal-dependent hydrolase
MSQNIAITGATIYSFNNGELKTWSPGTIQVSGNRIVDIREGAIEDIECDGDIKVIDAKNWILLPGFVNTHLHSHQTVLKSVPGIQNKPLDEWVNKVGLMQLSMSPDDYKLCTLGASLELMLSGVTMTADMPYIFGENADTILESTIAGAKESGIRYHLVRSGMGKNEEAIKAGLDEKLLESSEAMLAGFEKALQYHDFSSDSMLQVAIGPCGAFDLSMEECRQVARIADEHGLMINLHLLESEIERDYIKEFFHVSIEEFLIHTEFAKKNLWLVHCIYLNDDEISFLADHGIKIASCPTSNARGEGIAPITELLSKGVEVGVGVDGFASNDSGNFLSEVKLFRILQGARYGKTYLSLEDTFRCATAGGASVLGRHELGKIEKGFLADLVAFDLTESLPHAGHHHPLLSLFSCTPIKPVWAMVNGKIMIEDGRHKFVDEAALAREIQSIANFIQRKFG